MAGLTIARRKSFLLASVMGVLTLSLAVVFVSYVEPVTAAIETDDQMLARQVTIRRDTFGVPHIRARTEAAAAFGFGYAQAEDHCLMIARRLITTRGEAAKYFGREQLETDFLLQQFDNLAICRQNFSQLDPLMQRIYQAYIAGFNHYVAQHRAELPAWIPEFTAVDLLALSRAGAIPGDSVINQLQRKYPATEASQPAQQTAELIRLQSEDEIGQDGTEGSNAFALHGSRTTSGKAILLGNPHLSWSSLYWEAQVTVPGKINFFGSTLPGIPVLRAGFNEHLGWVTTNNNQDRADVYALTLDQNEADHYLFEGKSLPLQKRQVSVDVRNADGSLSSETRTFYESHLGPIIYRTKQRAFAYRSTMLEAYRYFEGFYRLSKARNLREWLAAMKLNLVPYSNFTYADAAGNILYLWNARLPKRIDDGTDYALDVPAETGKYVWQDYHPITDFPQLLNPRGGYIQNCNNPPWFTSLRDLLDPLKYPAYFEQGEPGLRPQLALEMLESKAKFSLADVQQMKFNNKLLLADRLKPDLLRALRATANPTDELRSGMDVLAAWDNAANADSKGAVLFQRFADNYLREAKQPYALKWEVADPGGTPKGLGEPELAIKCFSEAVRWTRQTYGSEAIAWGEVHRYRFRDIDLPGDGATGNYGAFRVMAYRQMPDGKKIAGWISDEQPLAGAGDAWVLAVEFAKPVRAFSVLAYGQTTDSQSKHSRDQIALFASHQYKRVWFTEREIRANLEREYHP